MFLENILSIKNKEITFLDELTYKISGSAERNIIVLSRIK